jgi:hypothetical protein
MEPTSPAMKAIIDAVGILQRGERQQARALLLQLWEQISPDGAPLKICTMAHFLADTEAELPAELEWDLRALAAAIGTREADDRNAVTPELAGFLPSLHLNAGDCYRRLGDHRRARLHARCGLNRTAALADDGYGSMIKAGLLRLQERLAEAE